MASIRIWKFRLGVPRNRTARTAMGGGLIAGGIFGFLPLLGFWMVPAGLMVLAVDSAGIRRWNRRTTVSILRRWRRTPPPGARGNEQQ